MSQYIVSFVIEAESIEDAIEQTDRACQAFDYGVEGPAIVAPREEKS